MIFIATSSSVHSTNYNRNICVSKHYVGVWFLYREADDTPAPADAKSEMTEKILQATWKLVFQDVYDVQSSEAWELEEIILSLSHSVYKKRGAYCACCQLKSSTSDRADRQNKLSSDHAFAMKLLIETTSLLTLYLILRFLFLCYLNT